MPKKHSQILFLNLYAFSLTGGVEKVSRNFIYALRQLFESDQWASYSLYDDIGDVDNKYTTKQTYKTFGGRKIKFIAASFWEGLHSPIVVLSHINLLLVAKLIAVFKPQQRFILFAHGIEVWGKLAKWKVNFIKKNVEIWAVSSYTKQQLIQQHQLVEEQIVVLNNSLSPFLDLPISFEKPAHLLKRYGLDGSTPILYTLNRLSSTEKYKGYDLVIQALAQLKSDGESFTYLLAGKADVTEKIRIEKLIEEKQLSEEVKLLGFLDEEELSAHFLLSDIFIMPSTGEGFGIVFIEAAAHGCQVIGGDKDGSTDALRHGELGQMIDPKQQQAIIAAIKNALTNAQHQPQLQQQLAVQHFGFEQYLGQVNHLLRNNLDFDNKRGEPSLIS